MRCRMRKMKKSGPKFDVFNFFGAPNLGASKFLESICKSTPLPTYWTSLVEIPWLVFHLW